MRKFTDEELRLFVDYTKNELIGAKISLELAASLAQHALDLRAVLREICEHFNYCMNMPAWSDKKCNCVMHKAKRLLGKKE